MRLFLPAKKSVLPLLILVLFSCKKNKTTTPAPTVVKEFSLVLSAKNENPAPATRTETGTALIKILSDNSVTYTITVNGLASGDALTAAHFHTGNAGSNGPVVLNFSPTFSGTTATGAVTGVRESLLDSLKTGTAEIYLNVHSTQVASGLVRAQVNTTVDWAMDVSLSGANEVPAVTTTATGTARLRVTSNGKLYSFVNVTGLTAPDGNLTVAHIHSAAAGANGSVLVGLISTATDFGVVREIVLTTTQLDAIKGTAALYVNAHSSLFPAGLVRGQIR